MAIDLEKYRKATTTAPVDLSKYKKAPTAIPQPMQEPEGRSIFESLVKRPIERLLVEPAIRTGEAIGLAASKPFVSPERFERMKAITREDKSIAGLTSQGVKSGAEGFKQVGGEALETAGYLYGGGKAAPLVKNTLAGRIGQSVIPAVKAGAVGGAAIGSGESLQRDDTFGEAAKEGAVGGVLGAVGGAALGTLLPVTSTLLRKGYNRVTTPAQQRIRNTILEDFEKSIKPNLPNKTTPTTRKKFNKQAVDGVELINENKAGLSFVDDATGETVTGTAPRTLKEMADSLEQTKNRIYHQYDTVARQAGEAGVKVETLPIANQLEEVINNKALQLSHPEAVTYAQSVRQRFIQAGDLDATVAQDVIKNYNNSLQSFYRNPTPEGMTRNAVDSLMVNNIRKALDEGIEGVTGAQYQVLKNQYGSLKAIERDIMRATLRDARKNSKGLIDYTDIFSGGQVVSGILSGNPAAIASGVTQKSISAYFKFLNNPNRAVKQMFESADKLTKKSPTIPVSTRKTLPPATSNLRSNQVGDVVIPLPSKTNQLGKFTDIKARGNQSNQEPAKSLLTQSPVANSTKNTNINIDTNVPKKPVVKKPVIPKEDNTYPSLRSKLKAGEILVKQKKTGKVGAILEKDFNTGTYERV